MGEDNITHLSAIQKDTIYKDMLTPLKAKISQILLYDTKAAFEFLQLYNEIIENEEQSITDLMNAIAELELKIQQYQSSSGKEKAFEERGKAILQSVEDLKISSIQLSVEEFENRFAELKGNYEENIGNYSFDDRDKIEREIYALQASLIMRQVAAGKSADELQQIITEQDKIGLNMFVVEQINNLKQKDGLKDIATKVNNIVMTDRDAVLNPKLWSWMNVAVHGKESKEQIQVRKQTTSTAMIVAPKMKNNILVDWISRVFSKVPVFPLQTIDLRKINIEWLSKYIPKSMLLELEDDRLSEENRQVDERYVPDSKAVILRMFKERQNAKSGHKYSMRLDEKQYELLKENGGKIEISIMEQWEPSGGNLHIGRSTVTMKSGDISKEGEAILRKREFGSSYKRLNDALAYANLLDKTFNTDFQQQLLQEIKDIHIDKIRKKARIYSNLISSFDKMFREYEDIKLDFEVTEEAKRKQFYEVHKFKEQLKEQDNEVDDEEQANTRNVTVKKVKKKVEGR